MAVSVYFAVGDPTSRRGALRCVDYCFRDDGAAIERELLKDPASMPHRPT